MVRFVDPTRAKWRDTMALAQEIKKELRVVELVRKGHEAAVAKLKLKEQRLRDLAEEFGGSAIVAKPAPKKPMSEEHRRRISESLKRRFAQQ
jgi:hypothetical protein